MKVKEKVVKCICKIAYKEADSQANRLCVFWHNQPKFPEEVLKLRKYEQYGEENSK